MNNKLVTSAEYPRHGPCQKQVDPQFKHFSRDMDRFQALFKGHGPFSSTFQDCENPVLCSALLLSEICLPEFQVDTFYSSQVLKLCPGQSLKCKNEQKAITPKKEGRFIVIVHCTPTQ